MRTQRHSAADSNKVNLTLFIQGDAIKAQDVKKQVEHYASALPGVTVEP